MTHVRIAVATTAVCVALVIAASVATGGGADWFLHLGETGPSLSLAQDVFGEEVDVPNEIGHDGASFWILARDPLLTDTDDLTDLLDRPSYRARRIGYAMLAAPWRLGGEEALLWGLVITNLVAVLVAGLAAADLAKLFGAPPVAAAAAGLSPAMLLALFLDLGDAVTLAALLVAISAALRRHLLALVVASALVGLSRESFAVGLLGLAVLGSGLDRRTRLLLVVPAAVAAIAWAGYVQLRLGSEGGGLRELTLVPFGGWVDTWQRAWEPSGDWASALLAFAVGAVAAITVVLFARRRSDLLAAAAPFALLLPFLTIHVLELPLNLVRTVGPLLTLLAIEYLAMRNAGLSVETELAAID